ncbi:MAG: T9SS type A sorting domain-containing protein [Candidatus Eisenbacteria bacterium]|nr:T9SS type A sorting domain-containing protein [Candidatus Latescibacterota bacterium]MBD3301817.1 T9SS type A sorting domain-containing protein [Candidatus Eisenbacteria bacterium]
MNHRDLKIALRALVLLTGVGLADPAPAADRVLAVTTDFFSAGSISSMETSAPWDVQADLAPIGSDAVARCHDGLIYVVNRLGADNVQVIDPSQGFQTIRQFTVGPGTNPQDIALVSPTRAYVTRYETNDLLKVDPSTGEHLGTISLAAFADDDGLCEMHRMHVQGDSLLVQVQRMFRQDWPDPWIPVAPSYLAVVDLRTDQLVDMDPGEPGMQGIALAGLNPTAPIQFDPFTGDLLVLTTARADLVDQGGIERVDPRTMQSVGMLITEQEIGGNGIDFALAEREKGYVVASDLDFNTFLASFDPAAGGPATPLYEPEGYVLTDLLVYPNGHLFLADRDFFTPGIRVYDTTTDALIDGPLDTGLPPFELLVLPDAVSGAEEVVDLDPAIGLPYPNPSSGAVRFSGIPAGDRSVSIAVFDAAGRQIRRLAGPSWNGRDDVGRQAAPGVYWIRVEHGDGRTADRSVRLLPR